MRRLTRFLLGSGLGLAALAGYLAMVGADSALDRAAAVAPWAFGGVVLLVVAEGLVDSIGVWASVEPLGRGLSGGQSVQFALAGDFFDTLSPAGPVTSEPIMARFIGVATDTSYSEALGVRTVAKYVKSATQLLASTVLVAILLLGGPSPRFLLVSLGGAVAALLVVGLLVVRSRAALSRILVALLAPVVALVSSVYRETPHDRATVEAAVDRFWTRALQFRVRPGLLALIALGGLLEQLLTAAALWLALAGTGTPVALLPIVAVVPLPQVASVAPIPASLGAYDLLLGGAIAVTTGVPAATAAAAVLVVRTAAIPFALAAGGLSVAFLRGWRP